MVNFYSKLKKKFLINNYFNYVQKLKKILNRKKNFTLVKSSWDK